MMEIALRLLLAGLILGVAARSVLARDAFSAVVAFVIYGLLLAVAWMTLGGPDVALTEAAIGGGVTGALLLGAARAAGSRQTRRRNNRGTPGMAFALCAMVSATLGAAFLSLPTPAPTLAAHAAEPLPSLGLGNPVTAVLIAYRAWDTLLEKVVLGLALAGVWALSPDGLWSGRPGRAPVLLPGDPLPLFARILPPFGTLLAVYLLWNGANHPGGAFQAGTVLAAMGILLVLAGIRDYPPISSRNLRVAAVAGTGVFLVTGLAGFALPGGFLSYPPGFEKPTIVVVEIALTFSIAVTLCLLVAGPPGRRRGT